MILTWNRFQKKNGNGKVTVTIVLKNFLFAELSDRKELFFVHYRYLTVTTFNTRKKIEKFKSTNKMYNTISKTKMSTKCYACNTNKRIQRLSFHILKEHFNSLLTKENIEAINESIKYKKGYAYIKITSLTNNYDNLRVYVSFGFNSGWTTLENAVKAGKDMTEEQVEKHLAICNDILKEYSKLEVTKVDSIKKEETTTTTDIKMKDLIEMNEKLKKKISRLEKEKKEKQKEVITSHDSYYTFKKHLIRLLDVDQDKYDLYEQKYNDIYEKYVDDDTKFDKMINKMTLNDEE